MSGQPIYSHVLWDPTGKPYWATSDGGKMYIPPIVAAQYHDDPRMVAWAQSQGAHIGTNGDPTTTGAPEGGGLHTGGTWNDQSGQYDQSLDWGNILAAGNAAGIAIPAVAGLVGGGGGLAGGGGGAGGSGVGIGETGAVTGLAGSGFGAVPAAAAGSSSLMPTIGKVASGIASNRAAGRAQEAYINDSADRTRLQGAQLNLQAPQYQARNAVRGDLLANLKPASFSGPLTGTHGQMPQSSGGLRPDLLSDSTRQLGGNMSRQALIDSMSGPAFTPSPTPQSNGFDSAMNGVGYLGLASPLLKKIPKIGGLF